MFLLTFSHFYSVKAITAAGTMMVQPLIGRALWRSFQSFQSLGNLMHAQGSLLMMDVARFEIF